VVLIELCLDRYRPRPLGSVAQVGTAPSHTAARSSWALIGQSPNWAPSARCRSAPSELASCASWVGTNVGATTDGLVDCLDVPVANQVG